MPVAAYASRAPGPRPWPPGGDVHGDVGARTARCGELLVEAREAFARAGGILARPEPAVERGRAAEGGIAVPASDDRRVRLLDRLRVLAHRGQVVELAAVL